MGVYAEADSKPGGTESCGEEPYGTDPFDGDVGVDRFGHAGVCVYEGELGC